MINKCQKLHIVNKEKLDFNSILLPKVHEILDFEMHLFALKLDKKNKFESDYGLVEVKNLLYIYPPSHPTSFTPESFSFIRNSYSNAFNLAFENAPDTKLFLTRRKNKFKRYLTNDAEIEHELKAIGVRILDGTENFLEIMGLFSRASHVAGVHGSLFTNNIYGNNKTKYAEYCPRNRENHTFHHQFKICESYNHFLVDGDVDYNISIDINNLKQFYFRHEVQL